ncbi:hypothetical protein Poli38472_001761 [Pythium oligandrum]|uniref:subtilisin n=1 Tax=Pythium oligandrum TaxID=41045 RepID=A0A8K1CVT7_PYTOL|nr:hypothetical protein Poli38472_001761 [Pythium oligandrum]|eukprot:TMW69605.1 hypothetical protein Poli38472_001761 [Pythium oligandrum]
MLEPVGTGDGLITTRVKKCESLVQVSLSEAVKSLTPGFAVFHLSAMALTKLPSFVLAMALVISGASAARVDPAIHRTLRQQGTANLIGTMKKGTDEPLKSVKEVTFSTRGALIEDLVSRLQLHAEESLAEVCGLFATEAAGQYVRIEGFLISNQIYVEGATASFVERLAASPAIGDIVEEEVYKIPDVTVVPAAINTTVEWGLEIMQAPGVWATGNTGEGVVVGTIDAGVRCSHEALKNNFRGDYGWFDPESKTGPRDVTGQGTHTIGTIVGANGISVAPGPTWIACKGCREIACLYTDVMKCFQFMACPTDMTGANPDCSKAPHVVNNSWSGGKGGSTLYSSAVAALRTAGVIPVFSGGYSGPGCLTATSPGDYENVISVGATNTMDTLASFSSKGPATRGSVILQKPDITAPGVAVRSSWFTGDSEYHTISGTSMASPHVTGTIALLLSKSPGLSYDQVRETCISNVDTASLSPSGYSCGDTQDGVFPNNIYGYGRLNALKAVSSVN